MLNVATLVGAPRVLGTVGGDGAVFKGVEVLDGAGPPAKRYALAWQAEGTALNADAPGAADAPPERFGTP